MSVIPAQRGRHPLIRGRPLRRDHHHAAQDGYALRKQVDLLPASPGAGAPVRRTHRDVDSCGCRSRAGAVCASAIVSRVPSLGMGQRPRSSQTAAISPRRGGAVRLFALVTARSTSRASVLDVSVCVLSVQGCACGIELATKCPHRTHGVCATGASTRQDGVAGPVWHHRATTFIEHVTGVHTGRRSGEVPVCWGTVGSVRGDRPGGCVRQPRTPGGVTVASRLV
jgi:hypothetical protein